VKEVIHILYLCYKDIIFFTISVVCEDLKTQKKYLCNVKVFYFNFSHDVQLSSGDTVYNLSKNVRALEYALQPLAIFSAMPGDVVAVHPEILNVCEMFYSHVFKGTKFVSAASMPVVPVEPWGWDVGVAHVIGKSMRTDSYVLRKEQLTKIRMLSSRQNVSVCLNKLLSLLPQMPLCGKSEFYVSKERLMEDMPYRCVLKAPWSSSGRGIRYKNGVLDDRLEAWVDHVIQVQGGVELEPYYNKLSDWAMEFYANIDGEVSYTGLSHFFTSPLSGYAGNVVAPQEVLEKEWSAQMSTHVFQSVRHCLEVVLSQMVRGIYCGPIGVDMMFCKSDKGDVVLHPCVEINFRRTMGQVAQSVAEKYSECGPSRMEIVYKPSAAALRAFFDSKDADTFRLLTPLTDKTQFVAYLDFTV